MIRFKLDENLPARAATEMREAGFDVRTALEQDLGGAADSAIADACATESRVLVTLDLDFADIRWPGLSQSPGIVVIRLPHQDAAGVCAVVLRALPDLGRESVRGSIWILEPHRIRVWRHGG